MTQFEYVSVAVALVFTLAVGRVLAGVNHAVARERRYLVHAGWVVHVPIVCVAQWWILWETNSVEWTAVRFLWVLVAPTLQYLRATVLLGDAGSVISYREHFYRVRRPYFALLAAIAVHAGLGPWVLGMAPWFTLAPVHATALAIGAIALVGLASHSERVHGVLVCVALALAFATFAVAPGATTG